MSGVISFVFSNPGHHAEIMLPVVRTLQSRGQPCRVVSIAELRGMTTPKWDLGGADVHKLMPLRRPIDPPRPAVDQKPRAIDVRGIAQSAMWTLGIGPRLRWLLRNSKAVVIPNDAVFPYLQLVRSLRARSVPFVLMQEGIRFSLPIDDKVPYGKNGAQAMCVWGQGSAEYFKKIGVPADSVHVTGNPRFDGVDVARFRAEGQAALAKLGIRTAPLLYLSSPIEIQGYGSVDFKLEMFATFLREAAPIAARYGVPIVIKRHTYEDPAQFMAIAKREGVEITVADGVGLFATLASARAAVVTASTVGLEALVFGVPLGALQIPGHGYAFEYVERGAAVPLEAGTITAGVDRLLSPPLSASNAEAFVDRHLAHRGSAREQVSEAILAAVKGSA